MTSAVCQTRRIVQSIRVRELREVVESAHEKLREIDTIPFGERVRIAQERYMTTLDAKTIVEEEGDYELGTH